MPVTSVICEPEKNSSVKLNSDKTVSVKGYAFSGGGNQIWRVDVSADGGKTWTEAELEKQPEPEPPRHWSWTIWTARVQVPSGATNIELCSKVNLAHIQLVEDYSGDPIVGHSVGIRKPDIRIPDVITVRYSNG